MKTANSIGFAESPRTTQFGRYRLLESIGQGGMADVMVAVMPGPARFNKLLVLKTIRDQIRSDVDQYAEMFLDEARLAARLNHPNVVHTYEVGDERGIYYIAMEYLEGQSLSQVQRTLGINALPLEARLRILLDTAHGLHHAHELTDYSGRALQVVHCDVSPQNIFLTYDGQVKLLDFGIAKMRDADAATMTGQLKGKIDYMAPEQLRGERVDRTADVFALGAIMWELLAGKPMSGGREIGQITRMRNRLTKQELAVGAVVPKLDGELSSICDKALAHDKSERYPTTLEFARDLQAYLAQRSLVPTSQQLSQIMQPAFEKVRSERRKRIEAALAIVEQEQTILVQSEHSVRHYSGTRLALPKLDTESDTHTAGDPQAQTQGGAPVPAPARTRPRTRQAAIVAIVVGAAAAFQLGSEPRARSAPVRAPRTESTPHVAVQSQPAPVDAPAATKNTVKLTVDARTPGVTAVLDGAVIPQLPFEADVARDNAIHKLVASAPGHETITQVLTLDRDQQVTLELPVAAEAAPLARRRRPRQRAGAASRTGATSLPEGPQAGSEELLPGQEMERQANGLGEISDEDPYR